MESQILVVARSSSALNKFKQQSLQDAFNLKDFLEETGDYAEVSIFQRVASVGPIGEWVKLEPIEC